MAIELTIELRDEKPHLAAVAEVTTDPDQVGDALGDALRRIAAQMGTEGVHPIGPPVAIYRAADSGGWHVSVGFPVDQHVQDRDDVHMLFLRPGRVAVGTHVGSYEGIGATWTAVEEWVRRHDLHPAGPPFERYLIGPAQSDDPSHWRTEVCWPVA